MDDVIVALTRLAHEERAALVSLACKEGLAREDAVECVQDAFCVFLQRGLAGDLPEESAAWAPFVAGIVRNQARNRRRRHAQARPHRPLDDDTSAAAAATDAGSSPASALDHLARAEEHVRLHACVARLCDTQRAVVTMRMLEERNGEDVAHALGVSRGYIDVLIHRAKGTLLACMEDDASP